MTTQIELPWPPSVNTYWRAVRGRNIVSKKGRAYRQQAAEILAHRFAGAARPIYTGRVRLIIWAFPPDRRRRDLDNLTKVPLDCLEGYVYENDNQVDCLTIERCEVKRGGTLWVTASERTETLRKFDTVPG